MYEIETVVDQTEPPSGSELSDEQRRTIRRCLSVLGVLGSGSLIGVASSLYLVNNYPLLLIALSPLWRHLFLVAPIVDPVAFVTVTTLRRLAFYLPCFYLGRSAGATATDWIDTQSPAFARFIRWLERMFKRVGPVLLLAASGPAMSTIAGSSQMRMTLFLPLATMGLLIRVAIVLVFADWLRTPIEAVLNWISQNWIPGTLLMVLTVGLFRWRKARNSRLTDPEARSGE